jgi:hypothetical protein
MLDIAQPLGVYLRPQSKPECGHTETAIDEILTHYALTIEAEKCSGRADGGSEILQYMVSVINGIEVE